MHLCPNCKENNRESARFCKRCGIWLLPRCPHCKSEIPDGSIYCDQCGNPLSPGRSMPAGAVSAEQPTEDSLRQSQVVSLLPEALAQKMDVARKNWALEGERRIVTILFCDLVGSTAAALSLDPEQWAQIVNSAFEHMIRPVYAYEGTVARLMGDGILAFFGAPVAHEDDPERAVRAGLDIVRRFEGFQDSIRNEWGIDVNIRVGVNTGLVLVGQVGSDLQMEYTALGDAINLAARMEQTAAPGTVQLAEDTYRHIASLFEFEDLGLQEVKGRKESVRSYRATGERQRPAQLRGIQGRSAPLIGRVREWDQLQEAAEANRKGVGRVIFLTGEAGIGKSRLIRELHEACQRQNMEMEGPEVRWFATSSLSYETSTPYAMFQRLLRRMAGADPGDSPSDTWDKISWFHQYFPEDAFLRLRQVFAALLNLPLSEDIPPLQGESFSGQLVGLIIELFVKLTEQSPVILVFDDLHWIDPASAELLQQLVSLAATQPLLILCATRPERVSIGWQLKRVLSDQQPHRFTEILLNPLSNDESNQLIDQLLKIRDFPDALREQILIRSEGNPFFVEEVLRTLVENGRIEIQGEQSVWTGSGDEIAEIPATIQALLTARIDRLPEDSRRILQMAALIGRTFYYRVLAALVRDETDTDLGQQLDRLQQAEFIREHARIPELEYVFHHMLTQEAAYHTILHQNRRRYHRLVGETMEDLFRDHLEDHAAQLVYHFQEGGDDDRCFRYSLIAGDAAIRLYARTEALRSYERARQLLLSSRIPPEGLDAEELLHLYRQRGRALELSSRFSEALENYNELENFALARGDRSLELQAIVLKGTVRAIVSDQFDEEKAIELTQAALEIASEIGDRAAEARVYWILMIVYRNISKARESLQAGEKSLALAEELGLREQIAFTSNDLSYVYLANGNMEKAIEVTGKVSRLWEDMGNLAMLADSLSALAGFLVNRGDLDEAFEVSDRAFEISRQIRNFWGQSHSRYMLGFGHWMRGDMNTAVDTMTSAGDWADQSGFVIGRIWSRCVLACLLIELGLYDAAREKLDEAEERSRQITGYLSFIASLKAYIAIRSEAAEIEVPPYDYRENNTVSMFTAPYIEQGRAKICMLRGEPEQAVEILTRLSKLELGLSLNTSHMVTTFLLYRAYRAGGHEDLAEEKFRAALQAAEKMEARWIRWELLADFFEKTGDPAHAERARADADWMLAHTTDPIHREAVKALFDERGYPFLPAAQAPE